MHNEFGKKPKVVFATVIAAVLLLVATATTISSVTTESVLAYDRNQAKSDINECGNGSLPENVGCQNSDSQIQGEENVGALTAQQTFPGQEPPPPPTTATVTVIKDVQCAAGQQCPGLPAPSAFTMSFIEPTGIPSFPGSSDGTPVTLQPGDYFVQETFALPPGLIPSSFTVSPECNSALSGPIQAGEERTCTFTNVFRPAT